MKGGAKREISLDRRENDRVTLERLSAADDDFVRGTAPVVALNN